MGKSFCVRICQVKFSLESRCSEIVALEMLLKDTQAETVGAVI